MTAEAFTNVLLMLVIFSLLAIGLAIRNLRIDFNYQMDKDYGRVGAAIRQRASATVAGDARSDR